ncbi:hypothetical protein [Sneathiella aquimaris]|uniref:hypothetical protein n=1 Tax=Sneathiella aquimaris TaxID=2599305 RepID=UPI00146AA04C|nr:hypothetical protein [Sneathiella aquimaris]
MTELKKSTFKKAMALLLATLFVFDLSLSDSFASMDHQTDPASATLSQQQEENSSHHGSTAHFDNCGMVVCTNVLLPVSVQMTSVLSSNHKFFTVENKLNSRETGPLPYPPRS